VKSKLPVSAGDCGQKFRYWDKTTRSAVLIGGSEEKKRVSRPLSADSNKANPAGNLGQGLVELTLSILSSAQILI
jgi:hypothetical protein